MNKFENIKVGDTVYIQWRTAPKHGFSPSLQSLYWVPLKVNEVKPTDFEAEGYRFCKQRGLEVDLKGFYCAHSLDEITTSGIVSDEKEAYLVKEKLIQRVDSVTMMLDASTAEDLLNLGNDDLIYACELLESLRKLI